MLTLEDTIEFFNLILEDHLAQSEKDDLLAFLLALRRGPGSALLVVAGHHKVAAHIA